MAGAMENHEAIDNVGHFSEGNAAHRSTTPLSHEKLVNHDLSGENVSAACKEFAAVVGADNVVFDRETLQAHSSTPWSPSPPPSPLIQLCIQAVLPRSKLWCRYVPDGRYLLWATQAERAFPALLPLQEEGFASISSG